MNPIERIPPGTVPVLIHWPTGLLHIFGAHYCDYRFCKYVGFRVTGDPDEFRY